MKRKIEKLIPYMDENFMTFTLMEEGLYFPQINLWTISNPHVAVQETEFEFNGYSIFTEHKPRRQSVLHYNISPAWDYDDKDSYNFKKEDWSIEEMIQIAEICKDGGIDEWLNVGSLELFSKFNEPVKEKVKQDESGVLGLQKPFVKFVLKEEIKQDEFGVIGSAENVLNACLLCKYVEQSQHSAECTHCLSINKKEEYYVR